jgi:hypothetical protein
MDTSNPSRLPDDDLAMLISDIELDDPTPLSKTQERDIVNALRELQKRRFGADGKTASVLENSNAIASAGNSALEPSASERKRGTCDCCGERPWSHHVGAHQTSAQCETFACCECANCDGCDE